jgi:hypothetical protein
MYPPGVPVEAAAEQMSTGKQAGRQQHGGRRGQSIAIFLELLNMYRKKDIYLPKEFACSETSSGEQARNEAAKSHLPELRSQSSCAGDAASEKPEARSVGKTKTRVDDLRMGTTTCRRGSVWSPSVGIITRFDGS